MVEVTVSGAVPVATVDTNNGAVADVLNVGLLMDLMEIEMLPLNYRRLVLTV